MKPYEAPPRNTEEVGLHLRRLWLLGGLLPLGVAVALTLGLSFLRGHAQPTSEPEQLALGFKGVMAAGGALFLLGFWLDGRWTEPRRILRLIAHEAGGASPPARATIREHAHLAVESLLLSVKALTVIGLLIGLAAVLAALAGLKPSYSLQILLLTLAFQVFIFSRHPYYLELVEAALHGELLPEEPARKA